MHPWRTKNYFMTGDEQKMLKDFEKKKAFE